MDDRNRTLEQKRQLAKQLLLEKMKRKASEDRREQYRS